MYDEYYDEVLICNCGYNRYIDVTEKDVGFTLDKQGNPIVLSDLSEIIWTLHDMGMSAEETVTFLAPDPTSYPHAFRDLSNDLDPWILLEGSDD